MAMQTSNRRCIGRLDATHSYVGTWAPRPQAGTEHAKPGRLRRPPPRREPSVRTLDSRAAPRRAAVRGRSQYTPRRAAVPGPGDGAVRARAAGVDGPGVRAGGTRVRMG